MRLGVSSLTLKSHDQDRFLHKPEISPGLFSWIIQTLRFSGQSDLDDAAAALIIKTVRIFLGCPYLHIPELLFYVHYYSLSTRGVKARRASTRYDTITISIPKAAIEYLTLLPNLLRYIQTLDWNSPSAYLHVRHPHLRTVWADRRWETSAV